MPIRRDRDGNIMNERTKLVRQSGTDPGGDETGASMTRRITDIARPDDAPGELRATRRYRAPTTPVRDRTVDPAAGRTRIYRPSRPGARAGDAPDLEGQSAPAADDPMVDPPVGWLVIIDGPGKGRVATLGVGVNSIGRDRTERVTLDYGDAMISRTYHGAIAYEPRGRKFYVQPGRGTNLTYANDEPVLAPRELEPSTHLRMGNTVLRFVPLCGVGFSWDDGSNRD